MSTRILPLVPILLAAACAQGPAPDPAAGLAQAGLPAPPAVTAQTLDPTPAPPPPAGATTVEEFDTTTEEERVAALVPPAPAAPPGRLGTTVASLGPPTDTGIWLETPLVTEPTMGRVEYEGQSVNLELRPSGGEPGSGSQISLAAMRLLGAPLTSLPELTVYSN